ncbi:MAG: GGDEF domain-containing protein [Oceanospirillaceae bacterium]
MNTDKLGLIEILEASSEGVAIIDANNTFVYENYIFSNFDNNFKQQLLDSHQDRYTEGYNIRVKEVQGNRVIYVDKKVLQSTQSDGLLAKMLSKVRNSNNVFNSTVEAINEITGWRWIFVTRFVGKNTVEVISFWNTDQHMEGGSYLLENTPCEVMVRNKKYTLFTDVAASFIENEMLSELGAKSYAGLVYYGKDQQPIGHVMCMHDSNDVDYKFMEDVIKLASLAISSDLLLVHAQSALKDAVELANIDSLTQLQNRTAFEEMCSQASLNYILDKQDTSIAIIDLNDFKLYNDSFGHPKGDILLRLFATELAKIGRTKDCSFRLGGDEFALLLQSSSAESLQRIEKQFIELQHRLSLMLGQKVSASIGIAHLSEVAGNIHQCYVLADKRMYEIKATCKLERVE